MILKNYSSGIDMAVSVAKIEKLLVNEGANNISKNYDVDRELEALHFSLPVNGNPVFFKIQARRKKIYELLMAEYTRPTERSREIANEQSGRTAWKIISDWVELQLTMIALDQMDLAEAFLTKALNKKGQTFFEVYKTEGFKLLAQ